MGERPGGHRLPGNDWGLWHAFPGLVLGLLQTEQGSGGSGKEQCKGKSLVFGCDENIR